MTEAKKLQLRASEIRAELAKLAGAEEEPDADAVKKLTDELAGIETRSAALAASEEDPPPDPDPDPEPDAQARELFGIYERSSLGRYVQAAAEGRSLSDGPERELNAGLELSDGRVPLAMLVDPAAPVQQGRGDVEVRADVATTISVNTLQRPEAWLARVFEGTASEFLGVARRPVSGLAAFPVVGSGATAKSVEKAAAKDAEVFGLSVETLEPTRISARYLFSREDAARLGMAFEATMRDDLRMSLATRADYEIINGADETDDSTLLIEGILEGVTPLQIGGAADGAITGATSGLEFAQGLMTLIDGRYAMDATDLRWITRAASYAHLKTLALAIGTTDTVFVEGWLRNEGAMGMASAHIGEVATDESYVIVSRARGLTGAAVHAVWDSVEFIRDPYTEASKGQIALTACMLHNFKVMRDDSFAVRRIATAA